MLVSSSRTGAARSAAILLVSCHMSAIKNSNRSSEFNRAGFNSSDEQMTKYLERQLEHQKQLLYIDIPSLRNHNKLFTKFCKAPSNGESSSFDDDHDDDDIQHYLYENESIEMGALPSPASETCKVAVKTQFILNIFTEKKHGKK